MSTNHLAISVAAAVGVIFTALLPNCAFAQSEQTEWTVPELQQRTVRFQVAPAKIYYSELLDEVPNTNSPRQADRDFEEREGQLGAPIAIDLGPVKFSSAVETKFARAPETFTLLRNSEVLPGTPNGSVSNVAEPSTASKGNAIFETYNWFSSLSTDNGQTRRFINPYTTFPNTPAAFTAGFCCDQRAMQATKQGLVLWFLQYIKNGATTTSTGGIRLAVAKGDGINQNPVPWQTYDFTAEQLGLTGAWFDFPHLQVSDNYAYFTTNIFSTATDAFQGSAIFRIPLAPIVNNQTVTADTFFTNTFGSILAINGSGGEGTRAGKTTMYFGSVSGTTSARVLVWPEASAQPTVTLISGLSTSATGTYTCTAPDATNPCGRANGRMQTGWINDTELGMMWSSNSITPARPFPFTRVLILNPNDLSIVSEPDIFSTTSALLYPAVSVSQRGGIGGIIDNLGGDQHTTVRAIIRDDLSPNVLTSGWELFPVVLGNAGAPARWGDYNGVTTHSRFPNTWLAAGHYQDGGTANANARIRSIWFARERDTVARVTANRLGSGTGTVTSAPTGVNCGATCFADFALDTQVTLTAAASSGSGFAGWTGACVGDSSTCVVRADQARNVNARFEAGQVFRSGFED